VLVVKEGHHTTTLAPCYEALLLFYNLKHPGLWTESQEKEMFSALFDPTLFADNKLAAVRHNGSKSPSGRRYYRGVQEA